MKDKLKYSANIANVIADMKISEVKGKGIYYTVGYQCLGPLLVGFCQWLKNNSESKNIDELLFFARDGYIIQKAYNILFPNSPSSYICISRRSVTVPQLVTSENWKDVVNTNSYFIMTIFLRLLNS